MPVRKLNRSGGDDQGGSQQPIHVDDAAVDIFVESLLDSQAGAKDGQSDPGQGGKDGDSRQKQFKARRIPWAPAPAASRLQQSTRDVLAALHEAKQELAQEMEANLKQLKAVLQETQRIAKDMEAVLGEAKGQPAQQEEKQENQAKGGWNPPTLKKKAAKQDQAESEADQQDDQSGDDQDQDQDQDQSPPPWEPPVDLHAQH